MVEEKGRGKRVGVNEWEITKMGGSDLQPDNGALAYSTCNAG